MDVVSFEVAKKLKSAGFPQESSFKFVYIEEPFETLEGRVAKGQRLCVHMLGYMAMPYLVPLGFKAEHITPEYENVYFAPGFLDLMKQLPDFRLNLNDGLKCDDLANMWLNRNE